jgi:hypothetical protein
MQPPKPGSQTTLIEWLNVYSGPIVEAFKGKTKVFVFRISSYLDAVIDQFFQFGFGENTSTEKRISEAIFGIKMHILNTVIASFSCLSQGLFIQSGILLRSVIEDCLVFVDIHENKSQFDKLLKGKYSTNALVSRVKNSLPPSVINWYGYFSANFTHFGPLHPVPLLPMACYPDNFILVCGLQDIVRAVVASHIVLERVYFDNVSVHLFWKKPDKNSNLEFDEESRVFVWAGKLGEDLVSRYPPNERKQDFIYDPQNYKLK